LLLINKYSEN